MQDDPDNMLRSHVVEDPKDWRWSSCSLMLLVKKTKFWILTRFMMKWAGMPWNEARITARLMQLLKPSIMQATRKTMFFDKPVLKQSIHFFASLVYRNSGKLRER